MQDRPGVRQIAADRVSRLPWLAPPAGYVVLIKDVAYGDRYKIARHQQLDRHQIERGADFPFQTRVVLILEAENAAEAERDLHDELAAGKAIGDWFDLDQFPKTPPAQTIPPVPRLPQESVSLRDLVENDDGADSLLQEANIVGARSRPSISRRPSRNMQHTARRRRPKFARWVFVLGLIVLVGVLVAEYSSDIGRVIESLLDEQRQQSTSPTPTVEGRGEVFFTSTRAHLRTCAAVSCRSVDVLLPGTRITASKYVKGQRVNGSTRWYAFIYQGELRYVHDSVLSRTWPLVEPTTTRTSSASPTPIEEGRGQVFFTDTRGRVRSCANTTCRTVEILDRGAKITARRLVTGQYIIGSDQWIEFFHRGQVRYIHSSALSATRSGIGLAPTATTNSRRLPAVREGDILYVAENTWAYDCASYNCDMVLSLQPGTQISAYRAETHGLVDPKSRWVEFMSEGLLRYVNLAKLSLKPPVISQTSEPSPTAMPTRIKATAVGQGEVFYVKSRAVARSCARVSCEIVEVLPSGTKITALRFQKGDLIKGSDRWIRFSFNRLHRSIHSSKLTRTDPNAESKPTAQPPRAELTTSSADETYYLKYRARPGTCARLVCQVLEFLETGTPITATGFRNGDAINGTVRWIAFTHNGRNLYVHNSFLTTEAPLVEQILPTSPTMQPTSLDSYEAADMQPLYVIKRATVYKCGNTRCQAIDVLERGTKIIPSSYWYGQRINDSNKWIRLRHQDRTVYLHSSYVSELEPATDLPIATELQPTATSTATEAPPSSTLTATEPPPTATSTATQPPPPTATATVAFTPKYVVETVGNQNAHIRSCPSTTCDIVAKFAPGTEVDMIESVRGETVYETDVWLEIGFAGGSAFIHSELVAEAG